MRTWYIFFSIFLLCLWQNVSAQTPPDTTALPALYTEYGVVPDGKETTVGSVTFAAALQNVIGRNPVVQATRADVASARGRLMQSRARLNPELSAEIEDLGRRSASGASQTTISISQPLELFGKRKARRQVAEAGVVVTEWNVQLTLVDLYREAAFRFNDAVAARDRVMVATERLSLMRSIQEAVQVKVTDGAVPKVELIRAESGTKLAEMELTAAQSTAEGTRRVLSTLWGEPAGTFTLDGTLDWWLPIPADSLSLNVVNNPELVTLRAELAMSEAEVRLARSLGKPDITLGAGYRRLHDDADNGVLVSLALPLPFFDRNKGGILDASSHTRKLEALVAAAEQRLAGKLQQQLSILRVQQEQVILLQEQVLPSARQALEELNLAYRLGSQPYINVLDAQRTLADLQSQLTDALLTGAEAAIEIETLTGHRLAAARR